MPIPVSRLILFLAHCYRCNLAQSTVTTYISALSYLHKVAGHPDPTHSFVIRKMLQGYLRDKHSSDCRLPITAEILKCIVRSLPYTCHSAYSRNLLETMYLFAFHAFLRVGEMTNTSPTQNHNISVCDVQLHIPKESQHETLVISMRSFKGHYGKRVFQIEVLPNSDSEVCPIRAYKAYMVLRGREPGPLFAFPGGTAISRRFFTDNLKFSLQWAGYSPDKYKGHSFRIGAASAAAAMGISDERIQLMGRWRSDAFKKYIRIPLLRL